MPADRPEPAMRQSPECTRCTTGHPMSSRHAWQCHPRGELELRANTCVNCDRLLLAHGPPPFGRLRRSRGGSSLTELEHLLLGVQRVEGLERAHRHPRRAEGEVQVAVSRGHVPVLDHLAQLVPAHKLVRGGEHVHVCDQPRLLLQRAHLEAHDDVLVVGGADEHGAALPVLLQRTRQLRHDLGQHRPARHLCDRLVVEAAVAPGWLEGRAEHLRGHQPLLPQHLVLRTLEWVRDVFRELAGNILVRHAHARVGWPEAHRVARVGSLLLGALPLLLG
mmetsp:Transcript_14368/g.36446  ORF Transcript_14368/g.36446 Transcript_14368/m.36446 type:complete len:277 (-) Transcript_14368:491-1321(-)